MQIRPPHSFGEASIGGLESKQLRPAGIDASDLLGAIREEALLLLRPDRNRELVLLVAAGALVAGFGLGWAGGLSWSSPRVVAALEPLVQKDSISRQAYRRSDALGGVDSKDSLLGANQIQGFFLGGSLGCDGTVGFERRGVGADGAADYRST